MALYRVVNRLGVLVAGQRVAPGDTVELDDEVAAPLVATGALEASKPKPKGRAR